MESIGAQNGKDSFAGFLTAVSTNLGQICFDLEPGRSDLRLSSIFGSDSAWLNNLRVCLSSLVPECDVAIGACVAHIRIGLYTMSYQ